MKLDSVLTVAIGDMDWAGRRLDSEMFTFFQDEVKDLLSEYGTVVAHATGDGIGSDGDNEGEAEGTAVFVAINVVRITELRADLSAILRRFGQTSACFAFDGAHEPCFNTADGTRPTTIDDVIDSDVQGLLNESWNDDVYNDVSVNDSDGYCEVNNASPSVVGPLNEYIVAPVVIGDDGIARPVRERGVSGLDNDDALATHPFTVVGAFVYDVCRP